MNQSSPFLTRIISTAAVFFAACVAPACADTHHPHAVNVGVILPLTGEGAAPGISFKNGMQLALQTLSPEARARVRFLIEDDQMIPKNTVTAYKRLRASANIDAVVSFTSSASHAVAGLAEADHVPLLAVGSDPALAYHRHYVINFIVMPETEASLLVGEALRRGYKRIVRINTIQQGTYALRDAFDTANEGRMAVAFEQDYAHEVKDFKPFITRLRQHKNIDAVMVNFLFGQAGAFARQLREAGIPLPIFGYHDLENPQEVQASNGALVGAWYANPASPTDDFAKRYRREFPDAALSFAAYGHDVVLLLAHGAERYSSAEGLNSFLHTVKDFNGALGRFSASGRNSFTLPATLKIVQKDGFEKLGLPEEQRDTKGGETPFTPLCHPSSASSLLR